ncbi:MAG: FecR domain-containing protein [Acidobacteriota bacterium]|jgi:hypothetical protein
MSTRTTAPKTLLLTSLTLLVPTVGALAQPRDTGPGTSLARIRYQEGPVAIAGAPHGGSRGVNVAVRPDQDLVTSEGRLELQLADGSLVRMDREAALSIRSLSDVRNRLDRKNWLYLASGAVYVHAERLRAPDDVFRLDTPAGSVYLLTEGAFRVETVGPDGRTVISAHTGVAEVVSEGISVLVRSGERSDVSPGSPPTDPRPFNAFAQDDFDRWDRARQGAYVKSYRNLPVREVPAEVQPFVTELAYYGDWVSHPDHGWIWRPPAAESWSPYRNGRWESSPEGWTWVASEDWGWAPYHYGRWERDPDGGWFWIPGSAWAGAWVAWAWGPGYLGWCPLDAYGRPADGMNAAAGPGVPGWVVVPRERVAAVGLKGATLSLATLERGTLQTLAGWPQSSPTAASDGTAEASGPPAGTRVSGEEDSGARVSFRTLEGDGRFRAAAEAEGSVRGPAVRRFPFGGNGREAPADSGPAAMESVPPPLVRATSPAVSEATRPSSPNAGTPAPGTGGAQEVRHGIRIVPVDDRRAILQRIFLLPSITVTLEPVRPQPPATAEARPEDEGKPSEKKED